MATKKKPAKKKYVHHHLKLGMHVHEIQSKRDGQVVGVHHWLNDRPSYTVEYPEGKTDAYHACRLKVVKKAKKKARK